MLLKPGYFRHCNRRYGCELWSLDESSINAFGVTRRKAVRRILNDHNNLLPLLLGNTLLLTICVSVQHDLYLNVFSQSHHL